MALAEVVEYSMILHLVHSLPPSYYMELPFFCQMLPKSPLN